MKKITKDYLEELANKLLFTMSDEEYEILEKEFDVILKQMDIIGNFKNDIDSIEPMSFPFEIKSVGFREDENIDILEKKDVLKNAKETKFDQIKINKVV